MVIWLHQLLQAILRPTAIIYLSFIAGFYFLWAIQPVIMDDWSVIVSNHQYFLKPCLPQSGQQIRYCFDGRYLLTTNQFSLFKPWILLTAVFAVTMVWRCLSSEKIFIKMILTVVVVSGFPFLGHIGPWNLAASEYTVSAVWALAWYLIYKKTCAQELSLGNIFKLFLMTFIAATWHELWIAAFWGIVLFLGFKALTEKSDPRKEWILFFVVGLAYLSVIVFYLYPGLSKVVDTRGDFQAGYFDSLWNQANLFKTASRWAKDVLFLLYKSIPLFLFVLFLKLNRNFRVRLEKDSLLFAFAFMGTLVFAFILSFIDAAFHYRVQLLAVYILLAWMLAIPQEVIGRAMQWLRLENWRRFFRCVFFLGAVLWMGYNSYFTYIYTNVDVKGWLDYRKMVVGHDPTALEGFCCRSLLFERDTPKVLWYHEWGEQNDQYRYYYGPPTFNTVKRAILAYWGKE